MSEQEPSATPQEQAPHAEAPNEGAPPMTTRILVVDDEEDLELLLRQKFRRRIRKKEIEFLFAHNGKEGLDLLEQNPDIHLVLSDINMPVMDGLTMLNQLSQADSDVQTVIVSAYGDMKNIRTAMNRGAYDFLTKPIDFNDLEITIDKGINHVQDLLSALESRDQLVVIKQELDLARQVQMSVQPKDMEPCESHDLAATVIPAREVGGDFYDFFPLSDDRLAVVIADVSGKGVPAALLSMVTKALVKATTRDSDSPAECLNKVNALLSEDNETCLFVTLFFAVLDLGTGAITYANAGHNPPRVLRADGSVSCLPNSENLVLGLDEEQQYVRHELSLGTGDCLFLYTDGITEAENEAQQIFGEERLDDTLSKLAGANTKDMIASAVDAVRAFAGGAPQSDDITCLAIRWVAPKG